MLLTASLTECPRKQTNLSTAYVNRKLSILASNDEMSNHSLSNSAICVRMLKAFVAISSSRPASVSPVHSIRRLLLASIACDQARHSD